MENVKKKFVNSIRYPSLFLLIMWTVHIVHNITGIEFAYWGIKPRDIVGLKGILFAPFIHGDWMHLISNSAPFFILMSLMFFFYPKVAKKSFILIYVLTGISVWLVGGILDLSRNSFHIGASGVVYGMLTFIFWSGIFRRSTISIVLSLIVTFLYSGMLIGIFPNQEGISWESHLFGAIAGMFVSYLYKDQIEEDEKKQPEWIDESTEEKQNYFPPNTFQDPQKEKRYDV